MKLTRANCANAGLDRQLTRIDMKKPNVRGPSPARKAHLALREKLNRKSKPAPAWPVRDRIRKSSGRSNSRRPVYGKD
jgi:hypothetical protein